MKNKKYLYGMSEDNTAGMTDVVFLLLIFFVVTSSIENIVIKGIDLPDKNISANDKKKDLSEFQIKVVINKGDSLFIGGELMILPELKEKKAVLDIIETKIENIKKILGPLSYVSLQAHKYAGFEIPNTVLTACRNQGISIQLYFDGINKSDTTTLSH